MDNELLQAFLEEVFSYLPTIRGGIAAARAGENFTEKLSEAVRFAHTIKGAALMVGFSQVGESAKILEKRLREIAESNAPISEEISRELLENVAAIEKLLDHEAVGSQKPETESRKPETEVLLTDEIELDIDEIADTLFPSFDDATFAAFSLIEEAEESSMAQNSAEEFEIDEEMLDVFAVEAEDLLRVVRTNLENLAENPNNRESLWEIRRASHTLKGSAGIVGLEKLSRLAHRVEDLLDFLAEHEIAGNTNVFEVLLTAADCLSALAGGEDSPQINRKIERLEEDFAATLALLQKKAAVEELPVAPAAIEPSPAHPANHSPTIRVSLERLDDLVNLVGEMVIIRSAFEQRLADFAAQNEELRNNARRLRNSTAKLETDFETDAPRTAPTAVFQKISNESAFYSISDNEFDALEFDNYTEFNQTTRDLIETSGDAAAIALELDYLQSSLEILFDRQHLLVGEMQDKLLRLRMVNFGSLTNRLQRTVRVTAEQEGKQVELVIENESLELNTQILDLLVEPLLHLLRNAVAHGIETAETRLLLGKSATGKIILRLAYEGMYLVLTVSDDGRGISPSELKQKALETNLITAAQAAAMSGAAADLIFMPGLTTSQTVSQVAGRGIGLSIVKAAVEQQKGTISFVSEKQRGASFTIRLPLPSAITRALLVKTGSQIFALPLGSIRQINEIDSAETAAVFNFENDEYKIVSLAELLGLKPCKKAEKIPLLLVEAEERLIAVAVEKVLRSEEIVIKPLDDFAGSEIYVGATVLGDGSVVPVLNLSLLLEQTPAVANPVNPAAEAANKRTDSLTILIVDDSPSVRTINSKIVKNAGWQPLVARDGLEALDILQAFNEPPDIILTDVEMPRMNGYELLAAIRRQDRWSKLPVVMITSRSGEKHRRKAFDLGVDEYVVKPYQDADLLEIIKNLTSQNQNKVNE